MMMMMMRQRRCLDFGFLQACRKPLKITAFCEFFLTANMYGIKEKLGF